MSDGTRYAPLAASRLGDTQRRVLEVLKRGGKQSVGDLARSLDLSVETIRAHMNALSGHGLVRRAGSRKDGPGRPEILYRLTGRAEKLFPSEEGRLLRELTTFLTGEGHEEVIRDFFEARVRRQQEETRERLDGLEGRERLEEVAAILSDEGFMAEVVADPGGTPRLRLCNCPLKEMVAVSGEPCRAEIAWIRELLGEDLSRESWMPEGDRTCTYAVE